MLTNARDAAWASRIFAGLVVLAFVAGAGSAIGKELHVMAFASRTWTTAGRVGNLPIKPILAMLLLVAILAAAALWAFTNGLIGQRQSTVTYQSVAVSRGNVVSSIAATGVPVSSGRTCDRLVMNPMSTASQPSARPRSSAFACRNNGQV